MAGMYRPSGLLYGSTHPVNNSFSMKPYACYICTDIGFRLIRN